MGESIWGTTFITGNSVQMRLNMLLNSNTEKKTVKTCNNYRELMRGSRKVVRVVKQHFTARSRLTTQIL